MMLRFVLLLLFVIARGSLALAAPSTALPSARAGFVDLGQGVRLHYVERGPETQEAARTLVFVHGFPDSTTTFDTTIAALDPSLRTLAIDLRGFGESSRPACCYTPRDFADDIVKVMDARKITSATLVGHSMGSFVAQVAALHYPDRVNGLVLIGSATTANTQLGRDLVEASKALTDPIDRKFVHEFQASTVHTPLPEAVLARYVDASMKVTARVWMETLTELLKLDTRADLRRIRARTLIIFGDRDSLFTRVDQDLLVHGIPNATLTIYENIGHSVQWEVPARVARDLEAFVRGEQVTRR